MLRRLCGLLALLPLLLAAAPPVETPPPSANPKLWDARIRYRIASFGNDRIRQYREMMKVLAGLGFERTDEPAETEAEDPRANRLAGTLPNRSVERLLKQRHVRSVLLVPKGVDLPEKDKRVRVEITLDTGYLPNTQRDLARQVVTVLTKAAGFVEAVGYDHRGFGRLVGSVPVASLDKLHDDPALLEGYDDQPLFRRLAALTLIIVRPDLPVPSGMPALPKVPEGQAKFDPALRTLLGDAAAAGQSARLEVILGHTPDSRDKDWMIVVEDTGAVVEGRTGPLVSVIGVVKEIAPKLAALKEVVAVRMPRVARIGGGPRAEVPEKWEPLRESGLAKLHSLGQRGKGVRVALVSDDFKGWEVLKGRKDGRRKLPDPSVVDLTATRNRDLLPDPYPSEKSAVKLGHGTRAAQALLNAAPEAELTLIRVDAAAPYLLEQAARAINGESMDRILNLVRRFGELQATRASQEDTRDALLEERKAVFADVRDDDEPKKRRAAYFAKQEAFEKEVVTFQAREGRYLRLVEDLKKMRGICIVASGLVWVDGSPVDGSSALSRYFDDRPFKAALWFQAAGDVRGQAWAGLFRDADGNGVMEFSDDKVKLVRGAWTREINFLAWQPAGKVAVQNLPDKVRVRLTLQWREPHDSLPLKVGEDLYREPLATLRLVLVRQHDPDDKDRPRDDLEVIELKANEMTTELPQRLNQTLNAATWEHVIEVSLPRAGRYGVFIEGKVPESIQARDEVRLPKQKRFGELRPRLFIHTLEGDGRAVWASYPTEMGSLGVPADSGRAVTVGAADEKDRARPNSASGPPYNLALLAKPDVLAYDEGGGTAEAASFAAGLTASMVGTRGSLAGLVERMRLRPGRVLRVPVK